MRPGAGRHQLKAACSDSSSPGRGRQGAGGQALTRMAGAGRTSGRRRRVPRAAPAWLCYLLPLQWLRGPRRPGVPFPTSSSSQTPFSWTGTNDVPCVPRPDFPRRNKPLRPPCFLHSTYPSAVWQLELREGLSRLQDSELLRCEAISSPYLTPPHSARGMTHSERGDHFISLLNKA